MSRKEKVDAVNKNASNSKYNGRAYREGNLAEDKLNKGVLQEGSGIKPSPRNIQRLLSFHSILRQRPAPPKNASCCNQEIPRSEDRSHVAQNPAHRTPQECVPPSMYRIMRFSRRSAGTYALKFS